MLYVMGQVIVCLMLTAILGLLTGWLARGFNSRAEVSALRRQTQIQLRDMRNRSLAAARSVQMQQAGDHSRQQQQLRAQVLKLQALVEQREKEIAHLRRLLGDARGRRGSGSGDAPPGTS